MSQPDFDTLLQKYLSGKCSPDEEYMVLKWYHHLIDESKLDIPEAEKEMIRTKIWANMAGSVSTRQASTVKSTNRSAYTLIYRTAIAASIILFVVMGWRYWTRPDASKSLIVNNSAKADTDISFTNKSEKEANIALTDGSIVSLQPKATLHYPKFFTGNLREVSLTGNAFFKVFRDSSKHFIVHTAGLVTEVLGTSFHIRQNQSADKFEIAVVTGKVSVYQQDKRVKKVGDELYPGSVILTTNQRVTFNAGNSQFITSLVEEPRLLDQHDKTDSVKFIFDDVPLALVLDALRKAYGVEIFTESKNLETCHFTGDITKQDLYKKLEIICQPFQSSYEVRGTTIMIKGKGCN